MGRKQPSGQSNVAIAYLRVSTDDQKLGPEAQRAAIEAWALREGVTVVAWHTDVLTGSADLEDRPSLAAALGELRPSGAGLFVVAKRDRLARDVYVAATIERAVSHGGARVVSADGTANGDTPADAFMRTILDAAAAYERALIRGRTKAALATKKSRGERVGETRYGYRLGDDGKKLVPLDSEQQVVTLARRLRDEGKSLRAVAQELRTQGLTSRAGTTFSAVQVARMLAA
jgi:site-specific DNA recombinase